VATGAAAAVVSVRLVLDEMFSPEIAWELVKRGHDVVAVAADPALVGLPDEQVLEWATDQGRCLVTENVKDDEVLRRASTAQGRTQAGLLYSGPRRFPRDRRFVGALVVALDESIVAGQLPVPMRWAGSQSSRASRHENECMPSYASTHIVPCRSPQVGARIARSSRANSTWRSVG
jgi:Domain of unknown function (DUF5615)